MVQTSGSSERTAFSRWLQTGTVPSALGSDGLERKFSPWHDQAGGRFTFIGAGRRYGYARGVDGAGSEDWPARSTQPKPQCPPSSATPKDPTRSTSPLNCSAPSAASAPGTGTGTGTGLVLREVEAVIPVEREPQEPGDCQSRNFAQGLSAVRQQPLSMNAMASSVVLPPSLKIKASSKPTRLEIK